MRSWLCLALAACGCNPAAPPVSAPPVAAPPVAASIPGPPPSPRPAAAPPRTAAHGAEITALDVTPDGMAAATADGLGGIRLWPTLDGSREPVVIPGTAPRAIALGRDGDGFAIATLDAAGGVELIRTTAAGAVRGRVTLPGDQPAVEIDRTREGVLIVRADQRIELVDDAGVVRARLTPEPGRHVRTIVVRGARVLALVEEDRQIRGQWIAIDHGARWGALTPPLAGKIDHAVLSPAGDVLAVSRPGSLHPALIDLATGAARSTALCVPRAWPRDGAGDFDPAEFLRRGNAPVPLGFLSAGVVACTAAAALAWWNADGTPHDGMAGSFAVGAAPAVMSDRALVVAQGQSLAIATPDDDQFLGYSLRELGQLHGGPGGVLIGGAQQAMVLDGALTERARFDLGRSRADWSDAVLLDERYALTATPHRTADRAESTQLAVFDGVARAARQVLAYAGRDKQLSYEPATRLLAISDGPRALLARYDPASHTFGAPSQLANAITPSRLVVVDPALAGGVAALEIDATSDGLIVGEIELADVAPGALVAPRRSYRVAGELRAVDRAGRLYVHAAADHDDVQVYVRGAASARLPGVAAMTLWPSPDGARIAAFAPPRLVMLSAAGEVRWTAGHWSGARLAWLPGGELVLQFPSGVARVDLDTGALTERRCGWGFGLHELPVDVGASAPTICDAAR